MAKEEQEEEPKETLEVYEALEEDSDEEI